MAFLTTLSNLAGLLNRLLDRWTKHDKQQKQNQRQHRRKSVAQDPNAGFSELFGAAVNADDRLSNSTQTDDVRPDAAQAKLDENG